MKQFIVLCLFFQLFTVSAFAQQYRYHVVKQGETVYSIAKEYNISEETIFRFNPDARKGIQPNTKLVVPVNQVVSKEDVEFKSHKVRRKETLFQLSQQYDVSIDDIKRYNKHLYAEELRRGERIRIPINLPKEKEAEESFVIDRSEENPLNLSVREHVVLPKETKYGISQKYNISVEELERLNPSVDTLYPGTVLKVSPKEAVATDADEKIFQYYLVRPQETIFSLTRRLGISRDSLIVLNPALAEGLKAGMVLKIPNLEASEISPYIEDGIVNLEHHITNFDTKNVAVMLPFHLDKINVSDTASNIQERLLRDGVLRISLDFYSGVLMAVDSAKALGISTNLRVYDTRGNANQVRMLINTNSFQDVDVVVGPLLQSTVEAAAQKLQIQDIPVISPITQRENQVLDNFIQTRRTEEKMAQAMLSYISENVEGKNLITIVDSTWTEKQQQLRMAFPTAIPFEPGHDPFEGRYIDKELLKKSLDSIRENWVILETDNIGIISDATSFLFSFAEDYDITLFTTNRNNSFESENISNYYLSKLNFHFPSVDKEYQQVEGNIFIENYLEKYGVIPNSYAIRGFDITYDVLLRLASSEDLIESLEERGTTQYVENKFDYQQRDGAGYFNRAIYIMAYDESMKLKNVR